MPPSPSLRRSPRGDPRDDSHKRGRSFESGLSFKEKEKDDDLALFNEMQSRERENFLLESTNDFEDLLSSRMKPFSDFKLGINIPARGESSDLLNGDDDKNDYEWLLTPPETPLFASLDDEPAPVNLVHSGRARSRPISLSRSSTMERSNRSSRGSPSPQRLSPSPRSGSSTFLGGPSSAPQSSPVPLRPSTPSRRPSPPPVKPSTPPPRSLTPTSCRTTGGSVGSVAISGTRGTSPVRTSRGNSASPKVRAWQSNIPGFSLEAPPNLRTSLADRPASYVRGSSPASRSSRDSSSKFGRQSMSPTPSRSIGSSHSQERDMLSSHSKGSLASSGDDDADSLLSVPMSVTERPMSRKGVSGYPSGKPSAFSKKSTKTFSPSSAPKRSFDSAMRQMDRKGPPNMFRPLLSSVPSSTFYTGKASSVHQTMVSRNSSVTTSSNASSDVATSGPHDGEGSDQYHDDMASDCARAPFSDIHDEVFAFDKTDVVCESSRHEGHNVLVEARHSEPADRGCAFASNPGDSEESSFPHHAIATGSLDVPGEYVTIDSHANGVVCSRCDNLYYPDELLESDDNVCPECKQKDDLFSSRASLIESEATLRVSVPVWNISEESHVEQSISDVPQLQNAFGASQSRDVSHIAVHEEYTPEAQIHESHSCPDSSFAVSVEAESLQVLSEPQITGEPRILNDPPHIPSGFPEMHKDCDKTNLNNDVAEGAGISVLLLNRSSSAKGSIIHGRNINSSAISYEDLSYARDLTSSMRSSVGHGSISASSSIDLTSARQGEMLVRRQLSGKLSDTSSKPHSMVSSFSGTSMHVYQGFGRSTSSHEGSYEGSVNNIRHIVAGDGPGSPSDRQVAPLENTDLHDADPSVARVVITDPSLMTGHKPSAQLEETSNVSISIDEGHIHIDEDPQKSIGGIQNVQESALAESFFVEEIRVPDNRLGQTEVAESPPQCSLSTMSEIEINDSHPSSPRSQIDMISRDDVEDSLAATQPDTDVKASLLESTESDHADEVVESTVTVEDHGGRRTRSLTLDEATDTILFCSSIVHDLAYKAASIAIEREKENLEPLEGSRPTVTIPERRSSDRKEPRGVVTGRTAKTQKVRKRRAVETEAKPPLTENDERSTEPVVRNVGLPNNGDSMKPRKLESKCNCTIM